MSNGKDMRRRLGEVVLDLAAVNGRIVLLPHERFDADAIGAAISLSEVFRSLGCETVVLTDSAPSETLSSLPLIDTVQVYEPGMTYSPFDLALAIDCHEAQRMGDRGFIFTQSRLRGSVDHHVLSADPGRLDLVVPTASSTCELAFDMISDLEDHLAKTLFDKDIAVLLLAGIITDTGRYSYSNTTPTVLRQAAFLLERFNVDLSALNDHFFERTTVGRLQLKGDVFSEISALDGGRILTAAVTRDMIRRRGIVDDDLANLASEMRGADGAEVSFLFVEMDDPPGVRMNIRSNGCFDAAQFAKRFGGGGHLRAAGATLHGITLDEARETVLREATGVLNACMGELRP